MIFQTSIFYPLQNGTKSNIRGNRVDIYSLVERYITNFKKLQISAMVYIVNLNHNKTERIIILNIYFKYKVDLINHIKDINDRWMGRSTFHWFLMKSKR